MANYIYAELNKEIQLQQYSGATTDTATVNIDNSNFRISADVNVESSKFTDKIKQELAKLDYMDSVEPKKFVRAVTEIDGKIDVEKSIINESDVKNLLDDLSAKQDVLGFEGVYDKVSNKVVTNDYMTNAIAILTKNGMHYRGEYQKLSDIEPPLVAGDVAIVRDTDYLFDGNTWRELGSANAIKHGEIVNSDFKENLPVSRIETLETTLTDLRAGVDENKSDIEQLTATVKEEMPIITLDTANHSLDISYNIEAMFI